MHGARLGQPQPMQLPTRISSLPARDTRETAAFAQTEVTHSDRGFSCSCIHASVLHAVGRLLHGGPGGVGPVKDLSLSYLAGLSQNGDCRLVVTQGPALEGLVCACCCAPSDARNAAQTALTNGVGCGGLASSLVEACRRDPRAVARGFITVLEIVGGRDLACEEVFGCLQHLFLLGGQALPELLPRLGVRMENRLVSAVWGLSAAFIKWAPVIIAMRVDHDHNFIRSARGIHQFRF